jgi:hypothetical protein
VYNEISRVPFNPYKVIQLIGAMFPEEDQSQSQDGSPPKVSPDSQRRIEMTTLVNHISKGLSRLSADERQYVPGKANTGDMTHPNILHYYEIKIECLGIKYPLY